MRSGIRSLTVAAPVCLALAAQPGYYGKQGKGFDRFFLAVPARGGQSAEVQNLHGAGLVPSGFDR